MAPFDPPSYQRVLVKLSGEALMGDGEYGIDRGVVERIAEDVAAVHATGIQVGLVVGGGKHLPRRLPPRPAVSIVPSPTPWACWPR